LKNSISAILLILTITAGSVLNINSIVSSSKVFKPLLNSELLIGPPDDVNTLPSGKIIEGGLPYITNFNFKSSRNLQNWAIAESENGTMLFANKRGLISFDGSQENYISIGKIPYSIAAEPLVGRIFIGTNNGFGLLTINNGVFEYKSLSDSIDAKGVFTKIEFTNEKVWFYSDEMVVSVVIDKLETAEIKHLANSEIFKGVFEYKDKIYLNIEGEGLLQISDSTAKKLPSTDLLADKDIIFAVKKNSESVILGCDDGTFYTLKGNTLSVFEIEAQKYITESILSGGTTINSTKFAISTLNGGSVIVNKEDGKTDKTINYRTGLPDDEIYATATDSKGGLWLSHEYGISRADVNLPVQNFSNYPGIEGKVNSVTVKDSILYAATTVGIYYLTELKDYKEIEVLKKKKKANGYASDDNRSNLYEEPESELENTAYTDESNDGSSEEVVKKKSVKERWKKFWKRKKRKKDKDDDGDENTENSGGADGSSDDGNDENPESENETEIKKKTVPVKKKTTKRKRVNNNNGDSDSKKTYELQSVKNIFKKVEGFNGKCKQIENAGSGLIASSNSGLFFILNFKAEQVIENAYIHNISKFSDNKFFVSSTAGVFEVEITEGKASATPFLPNLTKELEIFSFVQADKDTYWAGSTNVVYKISTSSKAELKEYELNHEIPERVTVRKSGKKLLFLLTEDIFEYNPEEDKINKNAKLSEHATIGTTFLYPKNGVNIIANQNSFMYLDSSKLVSKNEKYLSLFGGVRFIHTDNFENTWAVTNKGAIYKILPDTYQREDTNQFEMNIKSISTRNEEQISILTEDFKFEHDNSGLIIEMFAPFFLKQNAVSYSYEITGQQNTGRKKLIDSKLELPQLSPGNYTITVFAETIIGQETKAKSFTIKVRPPFYQTTWFWLIISAVVIGISVTVLSIYFKRREKKMKAENDYLEQQIMERTVEIRAQNVQITEQNSAILLKSDQIKDQNKKISKQNSEINASIRYASRIQRAVLPFTDVFEKYITEYFIIFKPRDVVSGDFYWVHGIDNKLYVTAADCTGHGVPGGFLSMLGISFLNEIIISAKMSHESLNTSEILDKLKTKVITSLRQSASRDSTKDGMDMAMVVIDKEAMTLDFSGANNPLFIVRDGQLTEIKADRMPIGFHRRKKEPFTSHIIDLNKGDELYLFSDGILDQFDGSTPPKRFMRKRFKNLVTELHGQSMNDQKDIIENVFDMWKGQNPQVDDVLVIGMKI